MDKATTNYDVVIVGAGPAGASAAIRLAIAGKSVLLVDKARFPRHKLCGEFVSPECLDHLADLGVMPAVSLSRPPQINRTVFYSSGGRSFSVASRWLAQNNHDSIGLSRHALDQVLLNRAVECGTVVETDVTVLDVGITNGSPIQLTLRSIDGSIRYVNASLVVDATGRGRYVARKFDAQPGVIKPRQVAFKAHLRGAAIDPGSCEIFSFPGGYGGCSPVEDGLFNLCFVVDASLVREIGSDPLKILGETILTNKRAATVLRDIAVESDWVSVPISRYGTMDPAPIPGILAIGDAAAFIDPFTGSGIAMALESSRIACEAMLRSKDPEEIAITYRRSHKDAFRNRLMVCRGLRFLSGSQRIADAMIAGLGKSEVLRRFSAKLTRSNALVRPPADDRIS